MIELVSAQAWRCKECGWLWFPRKNEGRPTRCPKRECRKLAGIEMPIDLKSAMESKVSKGLAAKLDRQLMEVTETTPEPKYFRHGLYLCSICKPPKEK